MSRINLLPFWREQRREQRKKQFYLILLAVLLVSAAIVYLISTAYNGAIETQNARDKFLSDNIHQLDSRLQALNALKQQRGEVLDRTNAIRSLQGNRPLTPRVFDQLVRTLPDGVYFNELSMKNGLLAITGVAESNGRVSSLMRNLNDSHWFTEPNLVDVKAKAAGEDGQANLFKLTVREVGLDALVSGADRDNKQGQGLKGKGK